MKKTILKICSAAAFIVGLGATNAFSADDLKFTVLTQTGIDNTFWQTIKRGMDDACEDYQVDCQMLFTSENGNLQMHLQNLETTIGQDVDGIATVIVDDNLYDEAIARAAEKGIPLITINVDDTEGADGVVGPNTRRSISAYQISRGLPATGIPSLELLRTFG